MNAFTNPWAWVLAATALAILGQLADAERAARDARRARTGTRRLATTSSRIPLTNSKRDRKAA